MLKERIIFMLLLLQVFSNECQFDVRMKQILLNDGFHRNLTYWISFKTIRPAELASSNQSFTDCAVGLEQPLPPGVFVNPDELRDLRRFGKVVGFAGGKVNVELPTEEASNSFVYLIGKVDADESSLWLPLHARYQKAQDSRTGMGVNIIPKPTLYLQCPDERLDLCGLASPNKLRGLCQNKNKCGWKEVRFSSLMGIVRWEVPVGDLGSLVAVQLGTALVVLAGSLYLGRAVHKFKRNFIRNKMD